MLRGKMGRARSEGALGIQGPYMKPGRVRETRAVECEYWLSARDVRGRLGLGGADGCGEADGADKRGRLVREKIERARARGRRTDRAGPHGREKGRRSTERG